MNKAVVISVDKSRGVFAVKAADGRCAVFCQSAGVQVQLGDLVTGQVLERGSRALRNRDGTCWAVGDTGAISMAEALQLVRATTPASDASANDTVFQTASLLAS